jgi:aldose 1-epimerase
MGKSSVLFPFPNRLNNGKYTWNDAEYQFPINNESTGNAIHGFVRHESFEVTEAPPTQNSASIRCMYEYAGDKPYYPFPFPRGNWQFTISDARPGSR